MGAPRGGGARSRPRLPGGRAGSERRIRSLRVRTAPCALSRRRYDPTIVSATRRSSKRSTARARAAAPISERRSSSPTSRAIAAVRPSGSRGGTNSPSTPSRTTSRQPRMSVSTSGSPIAAASIAERGSPSRQDASTKTSMHESRSRTSSRHPAKTTSSRARSNSRRVIESGLSGSPSPRTRNRAAGYRCLTRLAASNSSRYPFSATSRPTVPTTSASAAMPSSALSAARRTGATLVGSNRATSVPLPSSTAFRRPITRERSAHARSSSLWYSSRSDARAASTLGAEDQRAPSGAVLGHRPEPVHRVHDARHAREARRHAADHPRLGVVGVDQVEALASQDPDELGEGPRVCAEVPRSRSRAATRCGGCPRPGSRIPRVRRR